MAWLKERPTEPIQVSGTVDGECIEYIVNLMHVKSIGLVLKMRKIHSAKEWNPTYHAYQYYYFNRSFKYF